MISNEDRAYLLSRGYTDQMLEHEGWFSLPAGKCTERGLDVMTADPLAAVWCSTPAGTITALQVVNPREKAYRRFRTEAGNYLPVYLASEDDFQLWEKTGEVFLVEGIFDRVAVKCCGVNAGVFALLSRGLSFKMARFLCLHSKRVWLMLDRDEPGQEATIRITNVLKAHGMSVESIPYPDKDPSEMFKKRGIQKMESFLKKEMELRNW